MKRQIRIEGDTAYVPLTRGYEAIIDAEDAPLVAQYNWRAMVDDRAIYAVRHKAGGGSVLLHRELMEAEHGYEVDHIDGDGLNNRRSNIRAATKTQNQWNRRRPVTNKSGVKGVYWSAREKRWLAQIGVRGKRIHLGYFSDLEAAAAAYAAACTKLHGEFGMPA